MSETQQPRQADDDTICIISTYDWQSERDGTKTRVHIGKDLADAADAYFYAIEVKGKAKDLQWSEHFPTDYLAHDAGVRAQVERSIEPKPQGAEKEVVRLLARERDDSTAQRRQHGAAMRQRSSERVR